MNRKRTGKKTIIDFKPFHRGDVPESFADIEKSNEKLYFIPQISINEGIPKFIKWYIDYNG